MTAPVRFETCPPVGFVYCVAHHERRAVKIGWSRDPGKRVRQLQTASPDVLVMDGIPEAAFWAVAREIEAERRPVPRPFKADLSRYFR